MPDEYRALGQAAPIYDAALKATGQLRYVDDIQAQGMLYGKVLLSPVAHARIKRLDTAAAEALEGVRAVATYKNTPQARFNSTTRFFLQTPPPIESERIFDDTVRFIGDRVAAVAADTRETAEKALRLIQVEYEPLPVYTDPEAAMAAGACPLHGGAGNVAFTLEQKAGDLERGFAEADQIFEDRYTTPAVHHGAIEPHCAIADFDARGKLTVTAPYQNTFGERIVLSRIFNLPLNKIRVKSPAIGGGFGGKMESSVELVAAALAVLAHRPVKVAYTRMETMLATRTRHATVTYIKTGVKADGTITAQDIRVILNTGAYASNAVNVTTAMSHKVFKAFTIENLRFSGTAVYTNTPVAGAMRGYGSPQVYFAQQRQMHKIARALGLEPAALLEKNLVEPGGVDQRDQRPIGNPRPKDCLRRALALRENWRPLPEDPAYLTGTGLAVGAHCSGAFGSQIDQSCVIIKMNDDGSCILYTGAHDMGNSAVTTQMQVVSEILGIPMERIEPVAADTEVCGWTLGDFSSRGVYVNCHGAKLAAEKVRGELLREAAAFLGEPADGLYLAQGEVRSRAGGKGCSLAALMNYVQSVSKREIICADTYASAHAPGSYGVHMARVRVHKQTGEVEVTDYVAVHDVGKVLNPMAIEGQLEGAVQMGLGYALCEAMRFDENGRSSATSFRNYRMFRASEMPALQTDFIEAGEPTGAFGAKSIAECAVVPCAPAVINAVCDALGGDIRSLPFTPADYQARRY